MVCGRHTRRVLEQRHICLCELHCAAVEEDKDCEYEQVCEESAFLGREGEDEKGKGRENRTGV